MYGFGYWFELGKLGSVPNSAILSSFNFQRIRNFVICLGKLIILKSVQNHSNILPIKWVVGNIY